MVDFLLVALFVEETLDRRVLVDVMDVLHVDRLLVRFLVLVDLKDSAVLLKRLLFEVGRESICLS